MPAPQLQSRTPTAVGSNGRPQCQHLKGEVGNVSGLAQGSATSRPHKTSHRERTGRQNPEPQRNPPTAILKGFILLCGALGRPAALLSFLQIWLALRCLIGPACFGDRRGRASRCPKAQAGAPGAVAAFCGAWLRLRWLSSGSQCYASGLQ